MPLKAVLLDFNGIVINDEGLHKYLIEQLLLAENLRPDSAEYSLVCLGRSDRACIADLLSRRGRLVSDDYLDRLLEKKSASYRTEMAALDQLPLYPGLDDLIFRIRAAQLKLAVVSGARRSEIEWVLEKIGLRQTVSVIISCDDISVKASKPAPDGYLMAIEQLNLSFPDLALLPADCLAIEDSFAGIEAAKQAGVPVMGVAHTYPYQMIHRRATWVVDYLSEIDLDWLRRWYEPALNPIGSQS
ncbi:MAG: HAD family phosphatase [Cyanobacteria bacterium Co-bin13]|nr:HAD family phosphatase [Cyanobacteria bacterium Co-bin13]